MTTWRLISFFVNFCFFRTFFPILRSKTLKFLFLLIIQPICNRKTFGCLFAQHATLTQNRCGNFMREIDCAHRKILRKFFGGQKIEKNASKLGVISFNPNKIIFGGFWPPKKFFRIFSMCAIDFSHDFRPM